MPAATSEAPTCYATLPGDQAATSGDPLVELNNTVPVVELDIVEETVAQNRDSIQDRVCLFLGLRYRGSSGESAGEDRFVSHVTSKGTENSYADWKPSTSKYETPGIKPAWSLDSLQKWCRIVRGSRPFDYVSMTLIFSSAVVSYFLVDGPGSPEGAKIIDNVFAWLCIVDFMIYVGAAKGGPSSNPLIVFELTIVTISAFYSLTGSSYGLRPIKVLRVFRVLDVVVNERRRVVKIIESFSDFDVFTRPLRVLKRTCFGVLGHFVSVMLLLLTTVYALSIVLRMQLPRSKHLEGPAQVAVQEYFSDVWRTMVTFSDALFCGFDWWDAIASPLLNDSSTRAIGILVVVCTFYAKIAFVNHLIAFISEQILRYADLDRRDRHDVSFAKSWTASHLRSLLQEVSGGDDIITREELWTAFKESPELLEILGCTAERGMMMFQSCDVCDDGSTTVEQLMYGALKLRCQDMDIHDLIREHKLKSLMIQVRKVFRRAPCGTRNALLTRSGSSSYAWRPSWSRSRPSRRASPRSGRRSSRRRSSGSYDETTRDRLSWSAAQG